MNSVLTVRAYKTGSHRDHGWETFYRCRDKETERRAGELGIYVVGKLCQSEKVP